jgi:hypothetical protein
MNTINNQLHHGFKSHFSFAMATDFYDAQTNKSHSFKQNTFEKIGSQLCSPIGSVVDLTIKEMKNPIAIIGATLTVATAVTIMFYPERFTLFLPLMRQIQPWMIKVGLYAATEMTILGLGMRAFGHFNNKFLYDAWQRGEIEPMHVGDKRMEI